MGAPPFMRSVTMATMKAERELQRRRKAQLDAERAINEQVTRGVEQDIADQREQRQSRSQGNGGLSSSRRQRPGTAASGFGLPASRHMKRAALRGSNSQPKLAPLNLEAMRRKGRSRSSNRTSRSRASSRAGSQASYRSTYSRTPSVASSVRSSATVRHLASLLKRQNSQLKRGLRQQDKSRRILEKELRRVQQRVELLDQKRAEEAAQYKKISGALAQGSRV